MLSYPPLPSIVYEHKLRPLAMESTSEQTINQTLPPRELANAHLDLEITTLRFYMTQSLDISSATRDAHSLMNEPAGHRNQMMISAEGVHQTSDANLGVRINSLKNTLENRLESVAFGTLSFEEAITGNPRQVIIGILHDLPERYGAVAGLDYLDDLDDNLFFLTCRIILGQLCGILTIWPPKLPDYSSMASFAKELAGIATLATAGEASGGKRDDEGYSTSAE